jgi:hypothetical protein
MSARRLLVCLLLLIAIPSAQAEDWVTPRDFVEGAPKLAAKLIKHLDLSDPVLEAVAKDAERGDWVPAIEKLVDHYRERFPATTPKGDGEAGAVAEAILNDTYTFYTVTDTVPRTAAGGIDWTHKGPEADREWAWALNRHSHIGTLYAAWDETGDAKYVRAINDHLQDWVRNSPYPGEKSETSQWRGLEAALRQSRWVLVFTRLLHHEEFHPATALLMLSSLPDHALYLKSYHARGNWLTMEMTGLARIATTWPEFREAEAWLDYARGQMLDELDRQIYPDGVQDELTSHYHRVVAGQYQTFYDLLRNNGHAVSEDFAKRVEQLWAYHALKMRPDGYGALNNDSDRDNNRKHTLRYADRYGRADWRYIATNGEQGTPPEDGPSFFFPWAGQAVLRSGYDADAHWSFFDVGPYGTGHQHADKLHLSVAAYGRDLLVDGGRFTYVGGPFRTYAKGSASHNVLLVDGQPQLPFRKRAEGPLENAFKSTPEFDVVHGRFDEGYEEAKRTVTHDRTVFYKRGAWWLVLDRVQTETPRDITALWHFHPDCTVEQNGVEAVSTDAGEGNLRIVPSDTGWEVDTVRGQEEPDVQGWYSVEYNKRTPNTCVRYTRAVSNEVVFAWLLLPGKGDVPSATLALEETDGGTRVTVEENDGSVEIVTFPQNGDVNNVTVASNERS